MSPSAAPPGASSHGPSPRKLSWPLGIGIGCLLLVMILIGGGVLVATQFRDGDGPTEGSPSASESTTASDSSDGAVGAADLEEAEARFHTFLAAVADGEYVLACELMVQSNTTVPLTGPGADTCAASFSDSSAEQKKQDQELPETFAEEYVDLQDNGDGTLTVLHLAEESGYVMVLADDGEWYVDVGRTDSDGDEEPTEAATTLEEGEDSAAEERFIQFVSHVAASDDDAACRIIANSETHRPLGDAEHDLCVVDLGETTQEERTTFGDLRTIISEDAVDMVPRDDGTLGVRINEDDLDYAMVEYEGEWFVLVE